MSVSPQDPNEFDRARQCRGGPGDRTPVKVFGVPKADGSIKAYVVFYLTGARLSANNKQPNLGIPEFVV